VREPCEIRFVVAPPNFKKGYAVKCACGTITKIEQRPYLNQPRFTIRKHDKPPEKPTP
jgi:hypothetical protein